MPELLHKAWEALKHSEPALAVSALLLTVGGAYIAWRRRQVERGRALGRQEAVTEDHGAHIRALEATVHSVRDELRADWRADLAALRADVRADVSALRTEVRRLFELREKDRR